MDYLSISQWMLDYGRGAQGAGMNRLHPASERYQHSKPRYQLAEHITEPRRAWWDNPLHRLRYQIVSLQYDEFFDLPHCRIHAKVAHTRGRVIVVYVVESADDRRRFTSAEAAAKYVIGITT
jgi:hypothetical protein